MVRDRFFRRLGARALRTAYRNERLPPLVLWTLAAQGVRDWMRGLDRPLRAELGAGGDDEAGAKAAARRLLAEVAATMFQRRYDELRKTALPNLPDPERHPEAVAAAMAALHQLDLLPGSGRARWLWDGVGGAPRTVRQRIAAERLIWPLSATARWHEVATHLGEMLIAFTQIAPSHLPRAPQLLGRVCFEMGVGYATAIKRAYGLPEDSRSPQHAIEILRIGEYIFRVNPEHWSGIEGPSAFLEGTACQWYQRPGWRRMHCGIFGQFQSGVCSVFGLDYKLDRTIPKHGGSTCRVTMSPRS